MKQLLGILLGAATALAVCGAAFAQTNTMDSMHNAMSSTSIQAVIGQENSSNQTGSVSIKNVSGGVQVTIALKNEPAGASEPAHIHQGTCAKLNPAPWKPLSNVIDGKSSTMVAGVTVAQLKAAHYAVNVHQSAANLAHYVACADL